MWFFRRPRQPVSVAHGHLAYVTEDGTVLDLGSVTEEDMRLLNAVVEHSYRNRGSARRGPTSNTRIRVRGLVQRWLGVLTLHYKDKEGSDK